MIKSIEDYLRKNFDAIKVITPSVILLIVFILKFQYIERIYEQNGLNAVIFETYGGLLGLLLTAYAILFGLIPLLNEDIKKSWSFNYVNTSFIAGLKLNTLILLLGFGIYFTESLIILKHFFIVLQLFLSVLLLFELWFMLIPYICSLFKIASNKN